jgi:hypothetical protein
MRRTAGALSIFAVLAFPLNATARVAAATLTAAKKKTVWKKVAGPEAQADRWGYVEVTLVVRKTTTTTGSGSSATTKVTRKITGVPVPVYPDHTGRSVFISEQAIPLLIGEVLHAQMNPHIDLISGATYTSEAFIQSLQAAILEAKKV